MQLKPFLILYDVATTSPYWMLARPLTAFAILAHGVHPKLETIQHEALSKTEKLFSYQMESLAFKKGNSSASQK